MQAVIEKYMDKIFLVTRHKRNEAIKKSAEAEFIMSMVLNVNDASANSHDENLYPWIAYLLIVPVDIGR